MFIKLHNVAADVESAPKPSWVNSAHIIELFESEQRQFATTDKGRIMQPSVPCTYVSLTAGEGMNSVLYVLETPEQIMALLNGAQMHGASA